MRESTCKTLINSLEKIAVLALVLSLLGVQSAFARVGGIPGPPPPPCISTGILAQNGIFTGFYSCDVRNVGVVSHNVTLRIVNTSNDAVSGNRTPISLAPGKATGVGFPVPSNEPSAEACVVTTDEGTTDALSDLLVVMQLSDPAGETVTEGEIFNSCARPVLPPR